MIISSPANLSVSAFSAQFQMHWRERQRTVGYCLRYLCLRPVEHYCCYGQLSGAGAAHYATAVTFLRMRTLDDDHFHMKTLNTTSTLEDYHTTNKTDKYNITSLLWTFSVAHNYNDHDGCPACWLASWLAASKPESVQSFSVILWGTLACSVQQHPFSQPIHEIEQQWNHTVTI